eukprot:3550289-Prymnesium_polylepis.1
MDRVQIWVISSQQMRNLHWARGRGACSVFRRGWDGVCRNGRGRVAQAYLPGRGAGAVNGGCGQLGDCAQPTLVLKLHGQCG